MIQALAAEGATVLAEHGGNASLGDAIAIADLLGGFTGFVQIYDVGDILGGKEAFRARLWAFLAQQG